MITCLISMDSHSTIFLLDPHYRLQFLQHATRLLGCAYICIWAPYPHHSSDHLSCIGAWLQDEHDTGLSRTLFEEYRGSFCRIASGCVPGWAFKDSLPFLALRDSDLMGSASHQVQGQFYQESGIQTAVFVGCQNGEIELGMTNISPADLQLNVQQVFSEEFIQQSLLSELLQTPPPDQPVAFDIGRPSSSSSSLHSLSIGSSEDSPLFPKQKQPLISTSKAIASEPSPAPHQILMQAYGRNQNLQFPAAASDDEAMARAILAVISSSTTSNSYLSHVNIEGQSSRSTGAFKAYKSSSLRPRAEPIKAGGLGAQRMVKSVLAMLRRMYWMRYQPRMEPEVVAQPSGNQLHHMISERKRREKLNESFDALRKLLPPGSKKDKASVLSKTRDYLSTLKDQINELDEKNKQLEMQLGQAKQKQEKKADDQVAGESSETIQVEVTRASESTSESQRIGLRIVSRDEECDLADLILRVLGCLKEIGAFRLISVEANSDTPRFAQADLTLQVTGDNYNEASLKEAVKKVLEEDATLHQQERK